MSADRAIFDPGPITPLDIEAILTAPADEPLAPFVADQVSGLEQHHARIDRALDVMADDLAHSDVDTFVGYVDAAAGAHQVNAHGSDESFGPEIDAANRERQRLETLAAGLTPDGVEPEQLRVEPFGDEGEGVDLLSLIDSWGRDLRGRIDRVAAQRGASPSPSPSPSPQPGTGGGSTPPVDDRPPQRPPSPEPLPLPPPIDENPDAHGGITPPAEDGGSEPGVSPPSSEQGTGKFEKFDE